MDVLGQQGVCSQREDGPPAPDSFSDALAEPLGGGPQDQRLGGFRYFWDGRWCRVAGMDGRLGRGRIPQDVRDRLVDLDDERVDEEVLELDEDLDLDTGDDPDGEGSGKTLRPMPTGTLMGSLRGSVATPPGADAFMARVREMMADAARG